ncbi:hypothetical protein BpHYR1_029895 [Brachionus plicatilis]|uniref:SWIM-type domain-containing protein n=1 Tax=Brachionus plicatilis TaxID=10195 RepID=A0A3M7PZR9_BRAPC|nr:hypothetical protein BpHYR1_029895 [Brachionus plicatilis]
MEYDDSSNSSACSQASSNLESWIYLENNLKLDEIDNYISKILPPSTPSEGAVTNVLNACKVITAMITDLSKSQISFEIKLKRDNELIRGADKLTANDFQFISSASANRIVNGQVTSAVYSEPRYCTCIYFLEFGICKHYIAFRKLTNKEFDEGDREFVQLKKRGRPPKSKMVL